MKHNNAIQTIKKVSECFETKQKFAYVTYTRSAIFSAFGEIKGEKKTPRAFSKSVLDGLQIKSPNFLRAVQLDILKESSGKFSKLSVSLDEFYDPGFLEYYINNDMDIFKMFVSWYVKNTKSVIVSFQNESNITKHFSGDSIYIHVPYNDFYSRVDSISEQVKSVSDNVLLCILDCPMLGAALAPKIWSTTDLPIMDMGRSLNLLRLNSRTAK